MSNFLSEASREALARLSEADAADTLALDRIRAIREALAALDADPATLAAARDAEDAGASWAEIGAAAGLAAAAARWRWQGTDDEIAERHAAGRKRAARPSSRPVDLPGHSVADAARILGVTVQAVYQQVTRGVLRSEKVVLDDGRSYKRVHLDGLGGGGSGDTPRDPVT